MYSQVISGIAILQYVDAQFGKGVDVLGNSYLKGDNTVKTVPMESTSKNCECLIYTASDKCKYFLKIQTSRLNVDYVHTDAIVSKTILKHLHTDLHKHFLKCFAAFPVAIEHYKCVPHINFDAYRQKTHNTDYVRNCVIMNAITHGKSLCTLCNEGKNMGYYFQKLRDFMSVLVLLSGETHFVHNDMHLNNIMFDYRINEFRLIDYGRCFIDVGHVDEILEVTNLLLPDDVEMLSPCTRCFTHAVQTRHDFKKAVGTPIDYFNLIAHNLFVIPYKAGKPITHPVFLDFVMLSLSLYNLYCSELSSAIDQMIRFSGSDILLTKRLTEMLNVMDNIDNAVSECLAPGLVWFSVFLWNQIEMEKDIPHTVQEAYYVIKICDVIGENKLFSIQGHVDKLRYYKSFDSMVYFSEKIIEQMRRNNILCS